MLRVQVSALITSRSTGLYHLTHSEEIVKPCLRTQKLGPMQPQIENWTGQDLNQALLGGT